MPELFKDKFNPMVIEDLAKHIHSHWQYFAYTDFISQAQNKLDTLELKARSNQIKQALLKHMPADFDHAASIIQASLAPASINEIIQFETSSKGLAGWILMPVTDYITETTLLDKKHRYATGLTLLHACTQRFTSEFSIRPLLRDYTDETLAMLYTWAEDESLHVRRLASEGCRPYLPWGIRLHVFAENPKLIMPLLNKLKDDESEYVRRSVANNLNDIAKVHPDLVMETVSQWWDLNNKTRTKLIQHACRTLLKNGHSGALALFGYAPPLSLSVKLDLDFTEVFVGESQTINLTIVNESNQAQALLIDYAVYHQKANGQLSAKVFKWKRLKIDPRSTAALQKSHSFKLVTTRKYYAGEHKIEILINGKALAEQVFQILI